MRKIKSTYRDVICNLVPGFSFQPLPEARAISTAQLCAKQCTKLGNMEYFQPKPGNIEHLPPKVFEHQLCSGEVSVCRNLVCLIASTAFSMQLHPE